MIRNEIKQLKNDKPSDGERVLVFYRGQWEIFTYNDHYQVWDDSEGDDYHHDLDPEDTWTELPDNPENY